MPTGDVAASPLQPSLRGRSQENLLMPSFILGRVPLSRDESRLYLSDICICAVKLLVGGWIIRASLEEDTRFRPITYKMQRWPWHHTESWDGPHPGSKSGAPWKGEGGKRHVLLLLLWGVAQICLFKGGRPFWSPAPALGQSRLESLQLQNCLLFSKTKTFTKPRSRCAYSSKYL